MRKIFNFQFLIFNSSSGFTLIETLVVIFVLTTIGVLVAAIIASSLRGANKTNTITTVRQNGNYAITQMAKMVQNALRLDSPYSCVPPPSPTPAISGYSSIAITSFDRGQTKFDCDYSLGDSRTTIASISGAIKNNLLDTTRSVSLVADSCRFTCSQTSLSDPPIIGISFTLTQRSTTSFFEQKVSIPFQTSVVMRNVGR